MITIFETFKKIENTSSRLEITSILKFHKNNAKDDVMEKVLDIAMNPYRKFNIKQIPKHNISTTVINYYEKFENFIDVINKLETREYTGNRAKDLVKEFFEKFVNTSEEDKYFSMILLKNINIGLGWATVNEIYPGLIKGFAIQLCTTYDPKKHSMKNRIVQKKFNGLRGTTKFDKELNEWIFYSRNGKIFGKINYKNIENELNSNPNFKKYVFDSEIDAGDFQLTSSIAKTSKSVHPDRDKLVLRIFDCIKVEEFENLTCSQKLLERLETYKELLKNCKYLYPVEWEYFDETKIDSLIDNYLDEEFDIEGAVFKDIDSYYNYDRDESWLRIKPFRTQEFLITAINRGNGKYSNTTGSITVEGLDYETNIFVKSNVSGIKDEDKFDMWNNPNKYIGNYAEIKFQKVMKTGGLRHPEYIRLRNKDEE